MPSPTLSDRQERAQTGVRANGRKSKGEQQMRQASAGFQDAITQLIPAWVNASNASDPAACDNARQALGFAFDIQQQMLSVQRRMWDDLLNLSRLIVQDRTIHQDPDELGFYVEND